MTKRGLIAEVARLYPQYSVREAEALVNAVFASFIEALMRRERIELRGFGSFEVRERHARAGRNPRTQASVAVPAQRVPFFKVGKDLRLRVDRQEKAGARRRTLTEKGAGQKGL